MSQLFMKGNEAIAESAVRAGCEFFAGYPITPQNEIPEYLSWRLDEVGGVFVQGESEVAAVNMIYGASCAGKRVMTSTSGPGLSLKAEGISYLAASRLPAVIVDVARTGAGLGQIKPGQNDYWFVKSPGHGGFKTIVLAPHTVQEAVDLTYMAFDLADRDLAPVIVLADGVIGAMMEAVTLPPFKDTYPDKTSWILNGAENRESRIISSVTNDLNKLESFHVYQKELYESWGRKDVMVESFMASDAEYIIAAYGTSARIAKTAIRILREKGIKIGLIRPITIVPFPYEAFEDLPYNNVKGILVTELCIPSQMIDDIQLGVLKRIPVHTFGRGGGFIFSPEDIIDELNKVFSLED
ncbi:MAG: 3-methyl-2-oxobutanoate dehydrogenase subunit VorB [Eubacteriales bacterium]|nr:3-methyl-2-oxobutanoate dehydrogenase subunit VorB [Eubacteriales bacterium]